MERQQKWSEEGVIDADGEKNEWYGDAWAWEAVRLQAHKVIHYTLIVYLPIVSLDKIDRSIKNTNQSTRTTATTPDNPEILPH